MNITLNIYHHNKIETCQEINLDIENVQMYDYNSTDKCDHNNTKLVINGAEHIVHLDKENKERLEKHLSGKARDRDIHIIQCDRY